MPTVAVVLIVESDPGRREALREHLGGPCRVLEAARLEEAPLKEARSAAEGPLSSPDLIISDLRSSAMEALVLSRRVRADPHLSAVPVLLLAEPVGSGEDAEAGSEAEPPLPGSMGPEELRRLVGHHLAAAGLPPGPPLLPDGPLPQRVEAVVEARLGDPSFTAEKLAGALGLSRRQLTRRMKEEVGQAPAAYIRACRLDRARELLEDGPETIKEVARAVGFASPSAFSRAFREQVGASPSAYAERRGGEGEKDS